MLNLYTNLFQVRAELALGQQKVIRNTFLRVGNVRFCSIWPSLKLLPLLPPSYACNNFKSGAKYAAKYYIPPPSKMCGVTLHYKSTIYPTRQMILFEF